MKKESHIVKIMEFIEARFNAEKKFDDFKILLLDAGIENDNLRDFFVYPEGESFPVAIGSHNLKSKIIADDNFLPMLATSLLNFGDDKKERLLISAMQSAGFILDKNKCFYEKDRIIYEVQYNDIDREIKVNGEFITHLQLNKENDLVFDYLFNHPNKKITKGEIEDAVKIKLTKSLNDIVKNLKFYGMGRTIFFPSLTKTTIEFRNPITLHELKKRGIDPKKKIKELFFKK